MLQWILGIRIEAGHVLAPVYCAAAIVLLLLLVPVPGVLAVSRRWWLVVGAAAALGALAGSLAVWIVVDVQDVFGAPASAVIRVAAAATGAGTGLAIVNLIRTRWWRKVVAVIAIPAVLLAGALMINRDVAYYPTLGDAIGVGVGPLKLGGGNRPETSLGNWRPPSGMPSAGTVGTVSIPGVDSHWRARDAWVYLPPAALVKNRPKLPVVIAFSGQPGGPSDVFVAGNLAAVMNAIAAQHHGVAPIVVVPDQLGAYNVNPECENSKMGNVAQYVTDDVREWTLQHLPVSSNRRDWTVAGFSQGATCAVQFGTEYPAIFGSYLAISPDLGPLNGTVARSVREAFHGSLAEWKAAQPIAIMQRKRPYRHTFALYAIGALDTRYGKDAVALAAASHAAGMRTAFTRLPGVSHNWNTGAAGLRWGMNELVSWWGLP
ncbi:MAG: esterase family protein [Actinomycetota bacterium]|nr:esterase family protein [Actinomycetota bacterium]